MSNAEYVDYLAAVGVEDELPPGPSPFRRFVQERRGDETVECSYSSTHPAVWPHAAEHFRDFFFAREAMDFLDAPPQEPFALFLYLWAPHPPLRPPEPYASMFDPDSLELPASVGCVPPGEPSNRRDGVPAQLGAGLEEAAWRRTWSAHLGLTRLADEALGQVLARLERNGLADSTVTLFTVDHGDHLGERGMYQKFELYEPASRVPLVIRDPGAEPHRIEATASHLDVVPTVLELLGLPVPEGLDGRSLADAVRTGVELGDRPAFMAYSGNPTVGDIRRGVVRWPWKYVYDPEAEAELFNLEEDPAEWRNLAADPRHEETRRELHRLLADWGRAHGDWVAF